MLSKLWSYIRQEPVRVHLYTVVGLVLALLVGKGIIHENDLPYILGVAAAILGVENLRGKVAPVQPAPADPAPAEPVPAEPVQS